MTTEPLIVWDPEQIKISEDEKFILREMPSALRDFVTKNEERTRAWVLGLRCKPVALNRARKEQKRLQQKLRKKNDHFRAGASLPFFCDHLARV